MKNFRIVVHGGAGVIPALSADDRKVREEVIQTALMAGYDCLGKGGTAVEAAIQAVKVFEDSILFNAGRGSTYTSDTTIEMEASIMSGIDLSCGAVSLIETVKNPIMLAEVIRKHSRHVHLAGKGAEKLAIEYGLEIMPKSYFESPQRLEQLKQAKEKDMIILDHDPSDSKKYGTVGAVAIDADGNLAAATSTGGLTNKASGRLGDTSNIGAGTYANNKNICTSATGIGEAFLRANAGYACAHYYMMGDSLAESLKKALLDVEAVGGRGGMIAIDKEGNYSMEMNSRGMYRGTICQDGEPKIFIYKDE